MDNLIYFIFIAFFGYFIYTIFTKSGKGKMFGGEIVKTLDRHIEKRDGIQTIKIKIHVIKPKDRPHERDIGIELTQSAKLSWNMIPIKLNSSEAKDLSLMI
ncbi:MAG: hypothetical protein GTO02_20095, partial [Candidatus Dadabacteria bacterium]|nr:hypothetical protein [Candidatus Dadabacteria bacterium]